MFKIFIGDFMELYEPIKLFCVKNGISLSELARRLNKSPQALLQKIHRGTLSLDDLEDIAVVTGCKLDCSFILPNESSIKINI